VGTGFRIDFGFLMARFDFAWKAKDPSPSDPAAQNKWFYHWNLGLGNNYGTQFQLGINYPF
jgi:outer membrane protein insertion porin family